MQGIHQSSALRGRYYAADVCVQLVDELLSRQIIQRRVHEYGSHDERIDEIRFAGFQIRAANQRAAIQNELGIIRLPAQQRLVQAIDEIPVALKRWVVEERVGNVDALRAHAGLIAATLRDGRRRVSYLG